MPIEQNYYSLRSEMDKLTGIKRSSSFTMEYQEAYDLIMNDDDFKNKMTQDIEHKMHDKQNAKTIIKDKEYFREKRDEYKDRVQEVINKRNINVRNMTRTELIDQLVEDM